MQNDKGRVVMSVGAWSPGAGAWRLQRLRLSHSVFAGGSGYTVMFEGRATGRVACLAHAYCRLEVTDSCQRCGAGQDAPRALCLCFQASATVPAMIPMGGNQALASVLAPANNGVES